MSPAAWAGAAVAVALVPTVGLLALLLARSAWQLRRAAPARHRASWYVDVEGVRLGPMTQERAREAVTRAEAVGFEPVAREAAE